MTELKLTYQEKKTLLASVSAESFGSVSEMSAVAIARCPEIVQSRRGKAGDPIWNKVYDLFETVWLTTDGRTETKSPSSLPQSPQRELLYANAEDFLWLVGPLSSGKCEIQRSQTWHGDCLCVASFSWEGRDDAIAQVAKTAKDLGFLPHHAIFAKVPDLSPWSAGLYESGPLYELRADDDVDICQEDVLFEVIHAAASGDPRALRAIYLDGRPRTKDYDLWATTWLKWPGFPESPQQEK